MNKPLTHPKDRPAEGSSYIEGYGYVATDALRAIEALIAAPPPHAAQEVQRVPFTPAQRRRLYDNSPELHKDATSRAGFERIVTLTERAHNITAAMAAAPQSEEKGNG